MLHSKVAVALVAVLITPAEGWAAGSTVRAELLVHHGVRVRSPTMGFFDQLASAFENDETLGEAGPAGLKNKAKVNKITWLGPQPEGAAALFGAKQPVIEQEAIAGQKLKDLAQSAGIPIKYSCMQVRARRA